MVFPILSFPYWTHSPNIYWVPMKCSAFFLTLGINAQTKKIKFDCYEACFLVRMEVHVLNADALPLCFKFISVAFPVPLLSRAQIPVLGLLCVHSDLPLDCQGQRWGNEVIWGASQFTPDGSLSQAILCPELPSPHLNMFVSCVGANFWR